jgi:hypothetical protein
MQATAKSSDAQSDASASTVEPADPGYVGKHRPSRMSLMRQRVRVNQLANRNPSEAG